MDNLYENLENYEDENIVDELKRENSQLKLKLEEYSNAMEKLQKDFSKLSSEFKKLEKNYSSLLKTAKEEIERKSRIITNLNLEKDMMVLNSIHNKNISDVRRTRYTSKLGYLHNTTDKGKNKHYEVSNTTNTAVENEREELNQLNSEETITCKNTDIVSNTSNKDKRTEKTNNSKENSSYSQNLLKTDVVKNKTKALSIKNRRKSMPAIRCEAKFSTDEDSEEKNVSKIKSSNRFETAKHEVKHEIFNKGHNEVYKNRLMDDRHRISEASSMDDKYSSYHDGRDNRNRGKQFDNDKFRTRDRNDAYRYKRHYNNSPERFRRNTRNYSDEHFRQEYNRHRVLESPPSEKYHNFQRRNCEPRPRYDRDDYYDYERNKDRFEDKYPTKHKLQNDSEESSNKRRRNNSNTYYQEEKRWDSDRMPIQSSVPLTIDNFEHTSCQSPDYIIPDPSTSQPIKEIMNTAATQLEDPRLQSKKYKLRHINNDTSLLTVTGRDVDLKVIDTSNWNIEQVEIPKALIRRPSQCSEDFVKDVYIDIENPVSNMSVESGEIFSYATDEERSDKGFQEEYKNSQDSKTCNITGKTHINDNHNFKDDLTRYKIPKLNRHVDTTEPQGKSKNDPKDYTEDQHENKKIIVASNNKENTEIHKSNTDLLIFPTQTFQRLTTVSNELAVTKSESRTSQYTNKEIIEGDLELSDETNDCVDLHKKTAIESNFGKTSNLAFTTHISKNSIVDTTKDGNDNKQVNKNVLEDDFDKHIEKNGHENIKKHKSKKRSQKSLSKDFKTDLPVLNTGKRTRAKKDKEEVKEIKTKFCELFGDSSSLITPEDLGISAPQAQKQPSTKYIPVCEDAQDAVHLIVKDTDDGDNTNLKLDEVCHITKNKVTENLENIENKSKSKASIDNIDSKKRKPRKKELAIFHNEEHLEHQPPNDSQPKPVQIVENPLNFMTTSDDNVVTKHIGSNTNPQAVATYNLNQKPNLSIKALATSTPHKDLKDNTQTKLLSQLPQPNCDNISNQERGLNVDNHTVTEQSSINDTVNSQTDVDAPDVRIFVKRRRRVVKVKP